ncbi:Protein F41C3.5 [Aphelenchoides avenae]|nr:Protein F41C3.5 [Aphelenchus avenae]
MVSFWSLVGFLLLAAVAADPKGEIVDLPGLSFKPSFKHYSGFVQASPTRFLHYWFVESQGNPAKEPLVFWFNGGPGCSSLDGLLAEHGPYLLNDDTSTLRRNEYAWNKLANIVYLESPAGVGFSFVTDGDSGHSNDSTKFPHFRNHSVFVAGESYGGIYVPTLAERIIDGQKEFPMKFEGIAIGNGMLNWDLFESASIEFQYGHGFIDKPAYKALETCCEGDVIGCDLNKRCKEQHEEAVSSNSDGYFLNIYDIYRDCHVPGTPYNMLRSARKWTNREHPKGLPNCNPELDLYLNKHEVRAALHIPGHVGTWVFCGLFGNYTETEGDMRPQITKIVNSGVRVLLYYGDTDIACNFIGGQEFSNGLGLKKLNEKRAWTVDGFLGGFTTEYEKNLTYITVRGVGHMVPQWQPKGALYFMRQFVKNESI